MLFRLHSIEITPEYNFQISHSMFKTFLLTLQSILYYLKTHGGLRSKIIFMFLIFNQTNV